jgi:hypothetical protein
MQIKRTLRVLEVVLLGVIVAAGAFWGVRAVGEREQTERTTSRYDPPVWAGQNVPNACSGGFYARRDETVVLTIVAHCATPGEALRDGSGHFLGIFGARAQLDDCPVDRFCAPSDFLTLALAANRIPWGHLNMVDMGAGGYRTIEPGTAPLACADIRVGQLAEVDGREHFRSGAVVASSPYQYETDTMFPCMVVADIPVAIGDSGGAVLVDGQPAGVVSRNVDGRIGFTPLAEGLENLGLVLCTTANCDLSPESAVQPVP